MELKAGVPKYLSLYFMLNYNLEGLDISGRTHFLLHFKTNFSDSRDYMKFGETPELLLLVFVCLLLIRTQLIELLIVLK